MITVDSQANQKVADQSDYEDNAMNCNKEPFEDRREYVIFYDVNVIFVWYAIVVGAVGEVVAIVVPRTTVKIKVCSVKESWVVRTHFVDLEAGDSRINFSDT